MIIALRVIAFLGGAALVIGTLQSAVRTFVLPRAAVTRISASVFIWLRILFDRIAPASRPYRDRDRVLALYAPLALVLLPGVWAVLVVAGYTAMLWAAGAGSVREALVMSGSSLFTLGFERPDALPATLLVFSEAMLGLGLVGLLISYLPSIYSAFARRETAVTLLEAYADSPPSAIEMLRRHQRIGGLSDLQDTWKQWQTWFADVEESHTSLAALCFFRSPKPDRSWVAAAGCILDAASLTLSCLAIPPEPQAALCIRAGYLALRHVAGFFSIPYNPAPTPDDPISIMRDEFDEAWQSLADGGLPLKSDRDQAWRDFHGWRVNYDTVLLSLAGLTVAPPARWSGDRSVYQRPRIFRGGN